MGTHEVPDVHVLAGAVLIAITVLLCRCTSQASAGDIPQPDDRVTFDYEDGPRGPAKWGDWKPAWAVCKRGVRQSPMFITADTMVTDPRLGNLDAKFTSKCVPSNICNDGHEVELSLPASAGVLKIKDVVYRPAQIHFHMPSECSQDSQLHVSFGDAHGALVRKRQDSSDRMAVHVSKGQPFHGSVH